MHVVLATLLSNGHPYRTQLIAFFISLSPFIAMAALIIAAYVYQWHRNHRRHRAP